jgi:hypothetical protein
MSFAAAGRKQEPFDCQFKAHVIGTKAAGKFHIIRCLIGEAAHSHRCSMAAVGMDFHIKMFTADDGARVKMQLWDSSCQAAYRHATSSYLRGASAVAFAYNRRDRDSFDFIVNWIRRLDEPAALHCVIIVTDEGSGPIVVLEEEGINLANHHAMLYFSCHGSGGSSDISSTAATAKLEERIAEVRSVLHIFFCYRDCSLIVRLLWFFFGGGGAGVLKNCKLCARGCTGRTCGGGGGGDGGEEENGALTA